MLAHLAVLAGVVAVVLAPWPLAIVGARRRARGARAALGQAHRELTAPSGEGEAITLVGRLESDEPCTSFEEDPTRTRKIRPGRSDRG